MSDESADALRKDRPAGPELARIHEVFFQARGRESDIDWADAVFIRLVMDDVRIDVAEQVLIDAAETVRDSQVDPGEAYGPPQEWARERVAELYEAGLDVFDDALILDVRESVVSALEVAAGLSLLLFGSQLLSFLPFADPATELTVGMALMPVLVGAMIMTLIAVYKRAGARWAFGITVGISGLTVIVGSVAIAGLIVSLGQVGPRVSGFWSLALVPVYGVAAWTVAQLWRPRHVDPPALTVESILRSATVDDESWLEGARVALRRRGDLTEVRIEAVLKEAAAHTRDTGLDLAREFGSPEGYAQALPRDPRTVPRRLTLLCCALSATWAGLGLGHAISTGDLFAWTVLVHAVLTILSAGTAIHYASRWRRATRP
ncbi:hypothetical protein [Nocardioides alcanivorans]|uniref:hypothetical protein n=1 Tax=Nocardioides alcanivorans TaxID=2897352 RepID=UPI001F1FB114|nr:hypothetical protein [Nocardioides alcanivorans]